LTQFIEHSLNNRIFSCIILIIMFVWCLNLPAYTLTSDQNHSFSYYNFLSGFYKVEALIIYTWLPCALMILYWLSNMLAFINNPKKTNSKWIIITIHFGCISYEIIDMMIHHFHYNQTPLIAGYLALFLMILSFKSEKNYSTANK
jgi:hypothetical protein